MVDHLKLREIPPQKKLLIMKDNPIQKDCCVKGVTFKISANYQWKISDVQSLNREWQGIISTKNMCSNFLWILALKWGPAGEARESYAQDSGFRATLIRAAWYCTHPNRCVSASLRPPGISVIQLNMAEQTSLWHVSEATNPAYLDNMEIGNTRNIVLRLQGQPARVHVWVIVHT